MKKILLPIIVLITVSLLVIIIVGYNSDYDNKKERSALYFDGVEDVWEVLTDVEEYPYSKKDVEKVEILERNFGSVNKWREILSGDEFREYEVVEKDSPNLLIVNRKDSTTGIEGKWSYYLSVENNKTKLTIVEESELDNLFWRGIFSIFGRDITINNEFKWLRVKLFEELLLS